MDYIIALIEDDRYLVLSNSPEQPNLYKSIIESSSYEFCLDWVQAMQPVPKPVPTCMNTDGIDGMFITEGEY